MPIYEYKCPSCRERFEKLVRSSGSAPTEVDCPTCGASGARRVVSTFASIGLGSSGGSGGGSSCAPSGGG